MSCLFDSLSHCLKGDYNLREMICDFIETNPVAIDTANTATNTPTNTATSSGTNTATSSEEAIKFSDVIQWENGRCLTHYVRRMRKSTTKGGAIEIRAFCLLFGINVIVINLQDNRKIEFKTNNTVKAKATIVLTYTGDHYEFSTCYL